MNIDTLIFLLQSYKKYLVNNKDNAQFLNKLNALFLEGEIDEISFKIISYILKYDINSDNFNNFETILKQLPILYIKNVGTTNNDPCRGPTHVEYYTLFDIIKFIKEHNKKEVKNISSCSGPITNRC